MTEEPADLIRGYRRGVVRRDQLCDHLYKQEHPRLFRMRKRLLAGRRRWRRRRDRLRFFLPSSSDLRDVFSPGAEFVPPRWLLILTAPVVLPAVFLALSAFGMIYVPAVTWRRLLLIPLDRHRTRFHAVAAARPEFPAQ